MKQRGGQDKLESKRIDTGSSAMGCPGAHIYPMARSPLSHLTVTCARTVSLYLQGLCFHSFW